MNRFARSLIQVVVLALFVFVLVRFFPPLMRFAAEAAVSVVRFWWLVLILALLGWLAWVFKNRNSG